MEPQSNVYKYATWILVVVVIILGVMLSRKNAETITSQLGDSTVDIQACRVKVATWQEANPKGTPVSATAQAELDGILETCLGSVEDAQDKI
ncbi:MAG: hypothetical protein NUW02_03090 [Candidatus Campbellbacteria bacterium]|nr:hypothetical protein [Candidatus Campbellbacteria bacterium]